MNMPVMLADTAAVDARGSRGAKTGGSAGANDDTAASFDGVLSDVGTDETTSQSATPAAANPSASDPSAPTLTAALTGAADDPTLAAIDGISLEALMGFVSQAQTSSASASMTTGLRGTKATDKTSDGEESVDTLLKRIAKKDDDAKDSKDAPAQAATSTTDPRLDALTSLVAQIAPLAAAPAGNGQTSGSKSDRSAQTPVQAQQDTTTVPTQVAAKATIVSDIAIETHLAPALTQADGRAAPSSAGTATEDASKPTGTTIAQDATTAAAKSAGAGSDHRGGGAQDNPADKGAPDTAKAETAKTESATATPLLTGDLGSLRSIASAVVELAAAPTASSASVPDADTQAKTVAPARTLTLQMQPADLGTVDVRLHMSSDGLDLQLGISDERTLGMVSRERDTLTSMLQDQNYQVHSLVIQESSGGASSSSSGFSGSQSQQPQSESRADRQFGGSNSSDQGTSQRQQQGDRPTQNGRQSRETPSLRTPADSGNSLFV